MTATHARMLCACVLLASPTAASSQARPPRAPTIFAPASQVGSLSIRAAVVAADHSVKPLPLMAVVVRRAGEVDSVVGRTGLDGRLVMTLSVGSYTVHAASPAIEGRSFSWAVPALVRQAATQRVELTNANALVDSISMQAEGTAALPPPVGTDRQPATSAVPETRRVEPARYRGNTSGFFLGAGLNGSVLRSDDLEISAETGGGFSAQLGLGFTRSFALYVEGTAARMTGPRGTYRLAHVDAGMRWHSVRPTRALVPLLEVAVAGRAAEKAYEGDLTVAGVGVTFGAGLLYFTTRTLAVGGTVKWTIGEFSRVQIDDELVDGFEIDATSARVDFGFSWYPLGGKER